MNILVAGLLIFGVTLSPGQMPAGTDMPNLSRDQTPAGTTLVHFSPVDDGVYKGSKPRSDADYRFLQSLHVKYIVDLQIIPLAYRLEKREAKRYGIVLIPGRMNASPVSPSEEHIETILLILRDKRYHPIYFHCALGRDRTSLIAALYKMYFRGMSQQDAWQEMKSFGFRDSWTLGGLKRYFEKHPVPPPSLMDHKPAATVDRKRSR